MIDGLYDNTRIAKGGTPLSHPLPRVRKHERIIHHHINTYDDWYRLIKATGKFVGSDNKSANYHLEMGYDNLYNITSKKLTMTQTNLQFAGTLSAGHEFSYNYSNDNPMQLASVETKQYNVDGEVSDVDAKLSDNKHTQNYEFDKNGNMISVSVAKKEEPKPEVENPESETPGDEENPEDQNPGDDQQASEGAEEKDVLKSFLWDEENRLLAVNNNGSVSCYFYDAAGERTVKLTSESEMVHVNGKKVGGNANICKFTAYVSPYFVVSNGGAYTKHIYAASQRIASKLGNVDGFGADPRRVEQAGGLKKTDNLATSIKARYESLGIDYEEAEKEDVLPDSTMDSEEEEKLIFFYHPDHLGSTSYVTDADGNIAQHVEYIPYGEVFVEERNNSFSTNYLFNAKELDNETGLYYYGARYLDPTVAMWLSVDPMWEKYMGMSPYNYCGGNPVKLVDVDGRDVALMIAPEGANNLGHMAAIIQKSDGTCYYMTAGAAEDASLATMMTVGCKGAVDLRPVPKEFKRDEKGNVIKGSDDWPIGKSYCNDVNEAFEQVRTLDKFNSEYTDYITIKTTKEQDKKIFRNAVSTRDKLNKNKSNYQLLFNNCAEIVISCVEDGTGIDVPDGFTPVPNSKFGNIKNPFIFKEWVKSKYDDIKNYFNEEN